MSRGAQYLIQDSNTHREVSVLLSKILLLSPSKHVERSDKASVSAGSQNPTLGCKQRAESAVFWRSVVSRKQ